MVRATCTGRAAGGAFGRGRLSPPAARSWPRWRAGRAGGAQRCGAASGGGGEAPRGDAMGVARRVAAGVGLPLAFLWALNQQPPVVGEEVNKSDLEWRSELSDAEYYVMRGRGTERAGSSPLDKEKRAGVYACRGCGVGLFASEAKFNSGTGWPSFYDTLKDDQGRSRVQLTIQPLVRAARDARRRRNPAACRVGAAGD